MNEPEGHHAKQNESGTAEQMMHDPTGTWSIKESDS